jgi:hypothetical protein
MFVEIAFVVLLAVGVTYFFWLLLRSASAKIRAQYVQLAERFGLELTEPEVKMAGFVRPEPFVHGHYKDREISISAPGKGLQNTRQSETAIKVSTVAKDLQVQMAIKGMMIGLKQRDSQAKTRWNSGDAAFDAAVDVRTNQAERLTAILDLAMRTRILKLLKTSKGTLYVGKGMLSFFKLGLVSKEAERVQIELAADLLIELAESIER